MLPVTLVGGLGFITNKYALAGFQTYTLAALRFSSGMLFTLIPLLRLPKEQRLIRKQDWKFLLMMAYCCSSIYAILFNIASRTLTATNASLISALTPLITSILAALILKDRLRPYNLLALIIALFGVSCAITNGNFGYFATMKFGGAEMLVLIAVCCSSFWGVLSRIVSLNNKPVAITFWQQFFTSILFIPLAFIMEDPVAQMKTASLLPWVSVIGWSFLTSNIMMVLNQVAVREFGVLKISIFGNLTPIITIFASMLMLGEIPSVWTFIGAGLIIGGMMINTIFGPRYLVRKVKPAETAQ